MKPPNWAQDLIVDALIYLEKQGVKADLPDVKWRHSVGRHNSGGICYRTHITITTGNDRTDAKLVVLHELAHWVLPWKESHSDLFWDTAWELYRWAKLPVRYCLNREKSYRKGAVLAYKRSK